MSHKNLGIIIVLAVSFFLRFYNLMHDAPYFFNPDERNMAIAITRFSLPTNLLEIPSCLKSEFFTKRPKTIDQSPETNCNLNPHFFAYGQFPLYLAFISDHISHKTTNFPSAVYWLRFYSALSSVATVLIVYLLSLKLMPYYLSLIAATITAFTPGLIQSAHFGTTESLLTFFFLAVIYFSIKLSENPMKLKYILFISLAIGLAIGSKLTGLFFIFPPVFALIYELVKSLLAKKKKKQAFIKKLAIFVKNILKFFSACLLIIGITVTVYGLSSPYNLVEPENFKSAVFGYERDVATGKYEAFYTRQFFGSKPFIFQMEKVFPHTLGWPILIIGSLGFLLINFQLFLMLIFYITSKIQISKLKTQKLMQNKYLSFRHLYFIWILTFVFWIYFIPNSLLYAKWSRFMTPILPFFAIFAGYFIYVLQKFISRELFLILTSIFLLLAVTPGFAFMSIYYNEDTRLTASKWIYQNIPDRSYVLSETANVIDIPLGIPNYKLPADNYMINPVSFDFYHLHENPSLFPQLLDHLEKADYIFIPSRRIFKNHPLQPEKFKLVTKYHQLLFDGRLGFEEVAEFSSFPKILNYEFPDEDGEETFTVFDHPVIRIYKKISHKSKSQYQTLFRL